MNPTQRDLRLLPQAFKKFGFGVILLSLAIAIIFTKVLDINSANMRPFIESAILAGLLLIAFSKNAIEDELSFKIRLKGLSAAFIFGVCLVILNPFLGLLFDGDALSSKGSVEMLISMFLFYFLMVFLMKRTH